MSNPVRQVGGVSYASERDPVGYVVSKDHVYDFGVFARVTGAKTDPDGSTVKDRRGFSLLAVNDDFVLQDVVVNFTSDCGVKFDVIRLQYSIGGWQSMVGNDLYFYGWLASVNIFYEKNDVSTVLFTHVFDMSRLNESLEVRDLPGFKAETGGKLYAYVRVYSLNPAIPEAGCVCGDVTVSGTYRYQTV